MPLSQAWNWIWEWSVVGRGLGGWRELGSRCALSWAKGKAELDKGKLVSNILNGNFPAIFHQVWMLSKLCWLLLSLPWDSFSLILLVLELCPRMLLCFPGDGGSAAYSTEWFTSVTNWLCCLIFRNSSFPLNGLLWKKGGRFLLFSWLLPYWF